MDNKDIYSELLDISQLQGKTIELVERNTEVLKVLSIPQIVEKQEPPVIVVPDTVTIQNFPPIQKVEVTNTEKIELGKVENLLAQLIKVVPTIKDDRPAESLTKLLTLLSHDKSKEKVQELLKALLEKEYPAYQLPENIISKDGRIKVEVDRAGTGGGGGENKFLVGMEIPAHDYIGLTEDTLTDTWTYRTGGSGGGVVAVITITYTDSGKGTIADVTKT